MQSIRGELIKYLARISKMEKHIRMEKPKREELDSLWDVGGVDGFTRHRLAKRLSNLEDERASDEKGGSPISSHRMWETIIWILQKNTTLA